jgi:hypothetical protein
MKGSSVLNPGAPGLGPLVTYFGCVLETQMDWGVRASPV